MNKKLLKFLILIGGGALAGGIFEIGRASCRERV